ncbi:putative inorganic diphosphatase [Helianthus anomalus]
MLPIAGRRLIHIQSQQHQTLASLEILFLYIRHYMILDVKITLTMTQRLDCYLNVRYIIARRLSQGKYHHGQERVHYMNNLESFPLAIDVALLILECNSGSWASFYAFYDCASKVGWVGLGFLFVFGVICCYTTLLMKWCFESKEGILSYPDIREAAFGKYGHLIVSGCSHRERVSTLMLLNLSRLSTAAYVITMDMFGLIADNTGGIVEMSQQAESAWFVSVFTH